jgi:hypothetical protein
MKAAARVLAKAIRKELGKKHGTRSDRLEARRIAAAAAGEAGQVDRHESSAA